MSYIEQAQEFARRVANAQGGYRLPSVTVALVAHEIQHDQLGKCEACLKRWPVALLDSKPSDPEKPETCDWTILHCPECYGPSWDVP